MTVNELIETLKLHEGERVVVVSSDSEGNRFSPLDGVGSAAYKDGEIGYESLDDITPSERSQGYGEDDVLNDGKPCIVLWPR